MKLKNKSCVDYHYRNQGKGRTTDVVVKIRIKNFKMSHEINNPSKNFLSMKFEIRNLNRGLRETRGGRK